MHNSDELIRKIENLDVDAMLEDLKDEIDFDELFGRVPIEENDALFELKTFYNDYLTGFDFEEIRRYCQGSDDSVDIAIQDYFNERISNEKDEKKRFDFYSDYLIAFFYYHLNNGRFDEALSHIIQLGILASNSDDVGEGNIIERKPRSVEIHYQITQFLNSNPTFDLNNSYRLAIEDFKVEDWLNNEKEVFDAISELLT